MVWELETRLTGSINNSVLLTSLNLTGSHQSSVEPRVVISNNDESVRFYDVPMRVQSSRRMLAETGVIRLDVPVNHCEPFFHWECTVFFLFTCPPSHLNTSLCFYLKCFVCQGKISLFPSFELSMPIVMDLAFFFAFFPVDHRDA